MQEVESVLYSHFKTTANTIAQFYMGSVQLQRKSYAEGVKNTVEKINHFLLTHSASSSSNTASSSIQVNALVNFLDKLVEDVNKGIIEEKGKNVTPPVMTMPVRAFEANSVSNGSTSRQPSMPVNTNNTGSSVNSNTAANSWSSEAKQKNGGEQRNYFSFSQSPASPPNNISNANASHPFFSTESPALHSLNNTTTTSSSVTFDFSQNFAIDKSAPNMFMFTSPSSPFNSAQQPPLQQQPNSKKARKNSAPSAPQQPNSSEHTTPNNFSSSLGQQQQQPSQPNNSSRTNAFPPNNNSDSEPANALKRVFGDVFMMEDSGGSSFPEVDFGEASPLHLRVKRQRIVGLQ